jgi:hypothetical protein
MESLIGNALSQCDSPKACVQLDLRGNLTESKNRLEQRLADVNAAIDALDKNPEVARLLELVGKASRY